MQKKNILKGSPHLIGKVSYQLAYMADFINWHG